MFINLFTIKHKLIITSQADINEYYHHKNINYKILDYPVKYDVLKEEIIFADNINLNIQPDEYNPNFTKFIGSLVGVSKDEFYKHCNYTDISYYKPSETYRVNPYKNEGNTAFDTYIEQDIYNCHYTQKNYNTITDIVLKCFDFHDGKITLDELIQYSKTYA